MHHAPAVVSPLSGLVNLQNRDPSRKTAGLVALRESRLKTVACEINRSSFKLFEHPLWWFGYCPDPRM